MRGGAAQRPQPREQGTPGMPHPAGGGRPRIVMIPDWRCDGDSARRCGHPWDQRTCCSAGQYGCMPKGWCVMSPCVPRQECQPAAAPTPCRHLGRLHAHSDTHLPHAHGRRAVPASQGDNRKGESGPNGPNRLALSYEGRNTGPRKGHREPKMGPRVLLVLHPSGKPIYLRVPCPWIHD